MQQEVYLATLIILRYVTKDGKIYDKLQEIVRR